MHFLQCNKTSNSWRIDFGAIFHICNTLHGFKEIQKLNEKGVMLLMGIKVSVVDVSIGTFTLMLQGGSVLFLKNYLMCLKLGEIWFMFPNLLNIVILFCLERIKLLLNSIMNLWHVVLKKMFFIYSSLLLMFWHVKIVAHLVLWIQVKEKRYEIILTYGIWDWVTLM